MGGDGSVCGWQVKEALLLFSIERIYSLHIHISIRKLGKLDLEWTGTHSCVLGGK